MALSSSWAPLFGIASAVGYGLTDFWAAKAARAVGPLMAAFLVNLITLIAFAALYLALPAQAEPSTPAALACAAGAGVLVGLGILSFFKALALGPVSLVSPISSAYPFITTLMAVFAFQSELPGSKLIGIALVTVGVMVASGLFDKPQNRAHAVGAGPGLAMVTALCWGVGYGLMAKSLEVLSWRLATLVEATVIVAVFAVLLPFVKGQETALLRWSTWRKLGEPSVLRSGLIQLVALTSLNIGLGMDGAAAVVTAISASYPVLTMALAFMHLGERPTFLPVCGALTCVGGVVLLSLL